MSYYTDRNRVHRAERAVIKAARDVQQVFSDESMPDLHAAFRKLFAAQKAARSNNAKRGKS